MVSHSFPRFLMVFLGFSWFFIVSHSFPLGFSCLILASPSLALFHLVSPGFFRFPFGFFLVSLSCHPDFSWILMVSHCFPQFLWFLLVSLGFSWYLLVSLSFLMVSMVSYGFPPGFYYFLLVYSWFLLISPSFLLVSFCFVLVSFCFFLVSHSFAPCFS